MKELFKRNWKLIVGVLAGAAAGVGTDLGIRGLKKKFSKGSTVDPDDIIDYEVSDADKAEE